MSDERDIVEMMKDGSVHELATALQAERARIRELEHRLHERDLAVAALAQQLAACNPPQDSDAERTTPPSPSEAANRGNDSSTDV